MSAQALMQSPLTIHQATSEARRDYAPRAATRRSRFRHPIFGAALAALAIVPIALWQLSLRSAASEAAAPRHWSYVVMLRDRAPKSYGPFADATSCNLSLHAALADLNERLPGLFVARPCTAFPATSD